MARKGKDGLTAPQRKELMRYTSVGAVLAVAVMALFMVHYQMTALSRGAEPGPQVFRSGTAQVSGCALDPSTLWSMYRCRADDLQWTTNGPDTPGSNVDLGNATQGVTVWAHRPVSGLVAVESHATRAHEQTTDVYRDHEMVMPVGQFRQDESSYFLWYLGAMLATGVATATIVDRIGRRRILARGTRAGRRRGGKPAA